MPDSENINQHPLLIDLVLTTLAKLVPRATIANCRLVCKTWNYHFLPRFKNEYCVQLTEWKNVEKFVQLLGSSKEIPYSHFSISRISMNDPWMESVFEICGSDIQSLVLELNKEDIDICQFREILLARAPLLVELSFGTHEGLPEEVTNHCRLFPKWSPSPKLQLKRLNITFSIGKKFHPKFLTQLFEACPNLEEVNYRHRISDVHSSTDILISALSEAGSWQSLHSLSLGQIENSCVQALVLLQRKGIRLRRFSFEFLANDVLAENLEEFLCSQSEHLEELTLNECLGNEHISVNFPVMAKLRVLSITAFDKSQIVPHHPISFATNFPNLVTLEVYGWQNTFSWEGYFSEAANQLPVISVTKLQPPYRINEINLLKRLGQLFPAVTSLDITSPSNEVLLQLWSTWTELQDLEVFLDWNNMNVDSAFTGLTLQEIESIWRSKTATANQEIIRNPQRSIRNLSRLKTFICEIYEPWRDGEPEAEDITCLLTDVAGYGAFARMTHLQTITIARSDISAACVGQITKQFPMYTFIDIRGPSRQKLTTLHQHYETFSSVL